MTQPLCSLASDWKLGWREIQKKDEKKNDKLKKIDKKILFNLSKKAVITMIITMACWSVYISFFSNLLLK